MWPQFCHFDKDYIMLKLKVTIFAYALNSEQRRHLDDIEKNVLNGSRWRRYE